METEARPGLGERLSRRLAARERRRPRMGFTPAFYSRLGLEDPWAVEGAPAEAPEAQDGFVFLSAQPYYAMLRRLAAARKRRERRLAEFYDRRAGTRMRAAQRSWPGETPPVTSRLARLALEDAVLPPPIPGPAPVEAAPEGASPAARWTRKNEPTPALRSVWMSRERVPARVVRGSAAAAPTTLATEVPAPQRAAGGSRPLDRLGARAIAPARSEARALLEVAPARAGVERLRRVVELAESLPVEARVVVVRRAVRAAGAVVRQLVDVPALEHALGAPPPVVLRAAARAEVLDIAAGSGSSPARPAALRPVLSRSPAMALAASADTDRAASGTLAEAAHAGTPVAREAARPVRARRAVEHLAARERSSVPRPESVLPVAVPRVTAPRAARPAAGTSAGVPAGGTARAPRGFAPAARPDARIGGLSPSLATAGPADEPHETFAIELPASPATRARATANALARAALPAPMVERLPEVPGARSQTGGLLARRQEGTRAIRGVRPEAVLPSVTLAQGAETARAETAPAEVAGAAHTGSRSASATRRAAARLDVPARGSASLLPRPAASARPEPIAEQGAGVRGGAVAGEAMASRIVRLAAATVAEGRAPDPRTDARPVRGSVTRTMRGALATDVTLAKPPSPVEPAQANHGFPSPDVASELAAEPSERPAARRRAQLRGAAHASTRAPAPNVEAAPAGDRRSPTGPLRFARGTTLRDLLAPAHATSDAPSAPRRATRAPLAATLLAQAEAGGATVSGEAVVRLEEAGAPFLTAREASRRGYQVVATERGLLATRSAEAVTREGLRAPAAGLSAPRTSAAMRGSTRRLAGSLVEARYVVPVEVRTSGTDTAAEGSMPSADSAAPRSAQVREDAPVRTRAATRALARAEVETATAYRGAYATPTVLARADLPETAETGANREAGTAPARTSRSGGTLSRGAVRAARGSRTNDAATLATPLAAEGPPSEEAAFGAAPAGATAPRTRAPFEQRLGNVAQGRTDGATGWIDRAEGSPRLSTVSGLLRALARASTNEDVVRVIAARGELSSQATALPLDAPAVQVIQQIREEVREGVRAAADPVVLTTPETRASRLSAPEATALSPRALAQGAERTSRRIRSSAIRSAEATARRAAGSDDRLSKLVRRLQDLIHLAEDQNRLAEARGQVRMAEDSAQARAEGQGAHEARSPGAHRVDVDALGREVLDVVTKELELRRSRRMEDGDDSPWW